MPRPIHDIHFFGEIDLHEKTGKPRSQYPAWYFDVHIDELSEGIDRKERQLASGITDPEVALRVKAEIEAEKEKLETIKKSRPTLTGPQKDKCWNEYQKLADQLASTMPTRKQAQDGLVSPHEELKRTKISKYITVDPGLARSCGVKPVNGKITGGEAAKCFQILGKCIGETTNVETLRRDGGKDSSYKMINDLTQAILEGKEIKGT